MGGAYEGREAAFDALRRAAEAFDPLARPERFLSAEVLLGALNSVRLNQRPGTGGIMADETLRTATPESAVVIFTLRDDAATQERARAAGAAAFVAKHRTEETLLAAIREVAVTHGKQRQHDHVSAGEEEEHRDDMRDRRDQ